MITLVSRGCPGALTPGPPGPGLTPHPQQGCTEPGPGSCAGCRGGCPPTVCRKPPWGAPRESILPALLPRASFPAVLLLERPCTQATGPGLHAQGPLPSPLAQVSPPEPGRAWNIHAELPQPSWHDSEGEPCQEPVPAGLSDPWKPSQRAGSSRSQPTHSTKYRLCHQRGSWQRLLASG